MSETFICSKCQLPTPLKPVDVSEPWRGSTGGVVVDQQGNQVCDSCAEEVKKKLFVEAANRVASMNPALSAAAKQKTSRHSTQHGVSREQAEAAVKQGYDPFPCPSCGAMELVCSGLDWACNACKMTAARYFGHELAKEVEDKVLAKYAGSIDSCSTYDPGIFSKDKQAKLLEKLSRSPISLTTPTPDPRLVAFDSVTKTVIDFLRSQGYTVTKDGSQ